jgi:hypothetical protein
MFAHRMPLQARLQLPAALNAMQDAEQRRDAVTEQTRAIMTSSSEELSEDELKTAGGSAASTFGIPSLGRGQVASTYQPGGVALASTAYAAEAMAVDTAAEPSQARALPRVPGTPIPGHSGIRPLVQELFVHE